MRPLIDFSLQSVAVDGQRGLIVDIEPGSDPPKGVGSSDRDIISYVRRSATTFRASPSDIRAFVQSRVTAAAA